MDRSGGLPGIAKGAFRAFFVYDVADAVDLRRVLTVRGEGFSRAPLQLRREASSEFIQYPIAPLIVRLPDVEEYGASVRVKIFDYGVVSVRLTIPYAGPWDAFAALTRRLRRDPHLEAAARSALDDVLGEIAAALDDPHDPLIEDYFVLDVDRFDEPLSGKALTDDLAPELAKLLLFEDRPLVASEQAEALRVAFSYYPDDLVIVQWDAAFVYDRPEGAEATLDILEFANSQLVEFRTYDARLDEELDAIYALEPGRSTQRFQRGRESSARADRVRYLLVDILELTDRASNALKIIGDAYYARFYRAVSGRLGLADWQHQIDAKLRSVSEIYHVFQDQAQYARSEVLEYIVIVLIAVEAVIGVLALRH
jgi:hypothetical protein